MEPTAASQKLVPYPEWVTFEPKLERACRLAAWDGHLNGDSAPITFASLAAGVLMASDEAREVVGASDLVRQRLSGDRYEFVAGSED